MNSLPPFLLSEVDNPPFPLEWEWSVRHFPVEFECPFPFEWEWRVRHFPLEWKWHSLSKDSSELAPFLLREVEIPPFPLDWEWSVRHFPLEWGWHSIPL